MPYFKTENGNAENIKYDNTKSVKEAIDDIKNNQAASSVTFNNTDTGLNATNVQDAVTEVNGKLQLDFGIETKAIDVTTDSNGLTFIGGQLILAVTSDTPDTNITFFNNAYGMWYVKILKSSTGQPYVGNFRLYVLKLKE